MNVVMGLMWIAIGAVAVGSVTVARRHTRNFPTTLVACVLSVGTFVLSSIVLTFPLTVVTTDIDSARPVDVQCGSTWGSLQGSPYVLTDAGPVFSRAHGACQAAAWNRLASVGTAELGVAALLGLTSVLLIGRMRHSPAPETNRVEVQAPPTP